MQVLHRMFIPQAHVALCLEEHMQARGGLWCRRLLRSSQHMSGAVPCKAMLKEALFTACCCPCMQAVLWQATTDP